MTKSAAVSEFNTPRADFEIRKKIKKYLSTKEKNSLQAYGNDEKSDK